MTGIRYCVLEPEPCGDEQVAVPGSDSYAFSVARSDLPDWIDPEAPR